jgi:precorrin-6A synthase
MFLLGSAGMATRHIHVIGIGAGDPEYVTVQAIEALNNSQVFFAMDKGEAKSDLVGLRRDICARFIREPGYRFVELPDAQRSTDADYREAVSDWHAARARIWATAIATELGPDGAVAAEIDLSYDVIPGITAIQALTARHRIPLNDVGEPVLITTGRQLRARGLSGSAVVMLDGECSFRRCPPETRIWWGAYLGTDEELLVAGTIGEVGERIAALRADARAGHGWIMDTYLLRSAE